MCRENRVEGLFRIEKRAFVSNGSIVRRKLCLLPILHICPGQRRTGFSICLGRSHDRFRVEIRRLCNTKSSKKAIHCKERPSSGGVNLPGGVTSACLTLYKRAR